MTRISRGRRLRSRRSGRTSACRGWWTCIPTSCRPMCWPRSGRTSTRGKPRPGRPGRSSPTSGHRSTASSSTSRSRIPASIWTPPWRSPTSSSVSRRSPRRCDPGWPGRPTGSCWAATSPTSPIPTCTSCGPWPGLTSGWPGSAPSATTTAPGCWDCEPAVKTGKPSTGRVSTAKASTAKASTGKARTGQARTGQVGPEKLAPYQRKRDFARTPEPAGAPPQGDSAGPRRFVVQRHRARRLHYDLRFEIDGVLVSWAVPKGPTLDPDVKRTAIHVEDHPIEYLEFEGIIPRGEYGAGDVIVWDLGTWEPHATDDPAASVAAGELHADVTGHKLRGRLVLVRRGRGGDDKDQWLLLHQQDDYAVAGWDPEDHPRPVLSGRTNDDVKANPKRMWRAAPSAPHA